MLPDPLEEAVETSVVMDADAEETVAEASCEVEVAGAEEEVVVVVEAVSATIEEDALLADVLATDDSETKVVVEATAEEVSAEEASAEEGVTV